MKLPQICIRQPVLAIVLSVVLIVLGLVSFKQLEIRFFPKITMPVVTINTYYEGASADLMESQVTTPIENALAGVDGVQYISSNSWTANSSITVQFRLGGDFESEAATVRDRVSGVMDQLPSDANTPVVTVGTKGNPLLGIGFTDKNKDPAAIRDYIMRNIQPALRQLPGVGSVWVVGASGYALRIWLNAEKMASLGITVESVKNALTANNIYFPAGSIRTTTRNYSLVSDTRLNRISDFKNIIIQQSPSGTVRLGDIAKVELGYRSLYDYPMQIAGKNGVLLVVEPLQSANPIQVARVVHQAMANLMTNMPSGMHASFTFDVSHFLKSSIHETMMAIVEAVLLVMLVVFLFLGSLRAASIPIVTIPVSLVAVFAVMKLLGFSINTLSLLGMVLAIGLVVDDAIVVVENIHRYIERGMAPLQAALTGSREIAYAVVVMCLTLVSVYAPIGFTQGVTAALFKEFAFTLAGAVVISGFIAVTLSPMMCAKVLTAHANPSRFSQILDRGFRRLGRGYQRRLATALRHRGVIILILGVVALGGYVLMRMIPAEFIPQEDYGVVNVNISAPTGSSLSYTRRYTAQVEQLLKQVPAIKNFTTQIDPTWAQIRVTLKPWEQRRLSTQQVVALLNPEFKKIPGVTAIAQVPDVVDYGEKGQDITLNLMTTDDYQALLPTVHTLMERLSAYPGLMDVTNNLKFDNQQYAISVNRDLAATLGVNIQTIADTVSAMMSGNHWTDIQAGSKTYPVIVQMQKQDLSNFNALKRLYVSGTPVVTPATPSAGVVTESTMVPLSRLITLTPKIGQGSLHHFDRMRSGTVSALVAPGYTESQAIAAIQRVLKQDIGSHVRYAFSGKAAAFIQSQGSMVGIMLLSVIFIYLVLSAQFGSFIDPFIVLLAVPLSIVGALLSLYIGGGTFNLYSQIGLVTLVGLISKHGILMTQFMNDLRRAGVGFHRAIIRAASIRLRPILMTTAAMVVGSLPLALATGPGSVGRHQIGWVIVGGLLLGTFFSLIVVPVAYSFLGRFRRYDR